MPIRYTNGAGRVVVVAGTVVVGTAVTDVEG
jgi:hypothetical protein